MLLLLLLPIMICKHCLIIKLTLCAACQTCTHGNAEFTTALSSLNNYEMKCWLCFTVIALSSKCFSKLQWCNYNMLMIKYFALVLHFRKLNQFLIYSIRKNLIMITSLPFFTSISNHSLTPSRDPNRDIKNKKKKPPNKLGTYIFSSFFPCAPTLQLLAGTNWSS